MLNRQLDWFAERAILQDVHRDNVLILEQSRQYLESFGLNDAANLLLRNAINPMREGEYAEAWLGLSEIIENSPNLPPPLRGVEQALQALAQLRAEYDLP